MKKINVKRVKTIIVIIIYALLCVLCVTFFVNFITLVNKNMQYEVAKSLHNETLHYAHKVEDKVNNYYDDIITSLNYFNYNQDVTKLINKYADKNKKIKAIKVMVNNKTYTYNGKIFDGFDNQYIRSVYENGKLIKYAVIGNTDGIFFATTIVKNNKIIGVCEIFEDISILNKIIAGEDNTIGIDHAIINQQGVKIFGNFCYGDGKKYENYFDRLDADDKTIQKVKNRLKNNEIRVIEYNYKKHDIFSCYSPSGISGWYIISEMSYATVKDEESAMVKAGTKLMLEEILILAILFSHIIYISYKSHKVTRTSNEELKELNKELEISNKRYELITELSNSMMFEYNCLTDKVFVTSNYIETFGGDMREIINAEKGSYDGVHIEDHDELNKLRKIVDQQYIVIEFRKETVDGEMRWYRLYARWILDDNRKPLKFIGRIDDVNDEFVEKDKLKKMAENDAFTGMLNKVSTKKYVNAVLQKDGNKKHAFIIIDLDGLKNINDKLGHIAGDAAIKTVAEKIKYVFRYDDTIGRIGGDEFVVLMKNINSKENVIKKIYMFCDELANSEFVEGHKLSVSIGISMYPGDAISYHELYKKSDEALYLSKKSGKNTFSFYEQKQKKI